MTEQKSSFAKAFIRAQSEMVKAIKDSNNPHFKSKYADLTSVRDACVPFLNNNGIAVLQPIIQLDNKQYIKTVLLHESGEEYSCLTEIIYSQNTAQAHGSGITYARRYGLQSLVCIGADDDDGNAADKPEKIEKIKTISQDQGLEILDLLKQANITKDQFCQSYKIENVIQLPADKYNNAITRLKNKIAEIEKQEVDNANNN